MPPSWTTSCREGALPPVFYSITEAPPEGLSETGCSSRWRRCCSPWPMVLIAATICRCTSRAFESRLCIYEIWSLQTVTCVLLSMSETSRLISTFRLIAATMAPFASVTSSNFFFSGSWRFLYPVIPERRPRRLTDCLNSSSGVTRVGSGWEGSSG
jgi:hypothetical protein